MADLASIVGERIRNYRKERGLSQEELAHRASLHPTYIGQVERGEKNVTLESLEKITTALGVTLEELFRYVQPAGDASSFTLTQIVGRLQVRSLEDQKQVLRFVELLLEWRDK